MILEARSFPNCIQNTGSQSIVRFFYLPLLLSFLFALFRTEKSQEWVLLAQKIAYPPFPSTSQPRRAFCIITTEIKLNLFKFRNWKFRRDKISWKSFKAYKLYFLSKSTEEKIKIVVSQRRNRTSNWNLFETRFISVDYNSIWNETSFYFGITIIYIKQVFYYYYFIEVANSLSETNF